jgi:hypothetical protein
VAKSGQKWLDIGLNRPGIALFLARFGLCGSWLDLTTIARNFWVSRRHGDVVMPATAYAELEYSVADSADPKLERANLESLIEGTLESRARNSARALSRAVRRVIR